MEDKELVKTIANWLGSGSINIFGRPFAGKDTQGRHLAKLFNGTLLGGGDILRQSIMPDHIHTAMKSGQLIPSDDYVKIVLPYLSKKPLANQPLILSSVGRWSGEEKGVIKALEEASHPLKAVMSLNLSEAAVISRWEGLAHHDGRGGRPDDTSEILKTRLQEFALKTLPVIETYRRLGLLIEIDGSNPPDTVTKEIISALASRASASQ